VRRSAEGHRILWHGGYDWGHDRQNADPRGLVDKPFTALSFCLATNDMRLTSMSTIELVHPELREALAEWTLPPLTAESLTRRRVNALELIAAVPKPDLPDIAAGEIHVESAFGAKPIRVLTKWQMRHACRRCRLDPRTLSRHARHGLRRPNRARGLFGSRAAATGVSCFGLVFLRGFGGFPTPGGRHRVGEPGVCGVWPTAVRSCRANAATPFVPAWSMGYA